MTLSDDVNLEEFVMAKDELSGADIKAVCTESGLLALRERRMKVTQVGAPACRVSLYCPLYLPQHGRYSRTSRQTLCVGCTRNTEKHSY
jgi:SpoVK/Ycf46/Vps4 family AAA+-type ATPase